MSNKFINFNWEAGNYESKKLKKFIPYRNGNFKDIIENELRRRAHEKFEAGLTLASDISVDELDYYNCRELIELYLDIGNIERTETDSTTDIMAAFYEKVKEMNTVELVELLRNLEERTDKNYGHDYSGEHLRM